MGKKALRRITLTFVGLISAALLLGAIPGNLLYKNAFAEYIEYHVTSGNTLYNIAKKIGITAVNIKTANPLTSDLIRSGQASTARKSAALQPNQYRVVKGDTLYSIAVRHSTTITEIEWDNNLSSDHVNPGQVLNIPVKQTKPLKDILASMGLNTQNADIKLVADKSDHLIGVIAKNRLVKTYHMELGDGGLGDKQIEGDHKTPEGTLYIAEKSVLSPAYPYLGTRWMRLSYPTIEDADRGLKQGLIGQETHDAIVNAVNNGEIPPQNTALGGGVGVHGGSTPALGSDWTWGCLGLTNTDVEDFYDFVHVGTPIVIQQ